MKSFLKRIFRYLLSNRFVVPYLSFWSRLVLIGRKPRIIGITGSVGKTTTTDLLAAVLGQPEAQRIVGRVGQTQRNMNDDDGLPLTLLRFPGWLPRPLPKKFMALLRVPFRAVRLAFSPAYPKLLVLEYGTHLRGHLHRLARLAPPEIAIVTTIGPAHLERLKTLEGVCEEKSAVVRGAPADGLVVLGDGHDYVPMLRSAARAPVRLVSGRGVELSKNIVRVVGAHLGLPENVIEAGIQAFKPPARRLERIECAGMVIIDDSYNANPMSMELGLDSLAQSAPPGSRRVAILAHMGELGDESERYHRQIGRYARGRCDLLVGIGEPARDYGPDRWFESVEDCAAAVSGLVRAGDHILIKGSASARAARLVDAIRMIEETAPGAGSGVTQ